MRRFTPDAVAQANSLEVLRDLLHPGDTVYVITTQVARSGMSRRVQVLIARLGERTKDFDGVDIQRPFIRDITWHVARALRWQLIDDGPSWQLRVNGAGMDMHFHLVYTLSRALFAHMDRSEVQKITRNGMSPDPGYLLIKESL